MKNYEIRIESAKSIRYLELLDSRIANVYLNWIWQVFAMRVSLMSEDLDKGFIFDDVGCEVASVDAPSIDPNRSFTLKHSRTRGMTVYNEGTTTPRVCPRSGVGRIRAFGGFAFFVDHLDVGDQVAALCLPWLIWQKTAMHDHCIDCAS